MAINPNQFHEQGNFSPHGSSPKAPPKKSADGGYEDDFLVDDTDLVCTAAGVGGVFIAESASIIEVCQDADDLSIIYMIVNLSGPFTYTPTVKVGWGAGFLVNISNNYIANYKQESPTSFPIDTGCGSTTILLAYRIGTSVPEWSSVSELFIEAQFFGSPSIGFFSEVLDDASTSINPKATTTFTKGVHPQPYSIFFDAVTGKLKIQYVGLGDKPCLCAINCTTPQEEDFALTACENEIQEIEVDSTSLVGDPTDVHLTFVDAVGNETEVLVQPMLEVVPMKPMSSYQAFPHRINVGINFITRNNKKLDPSKLQYQIWRYENNPGSAKVWKDWSSRKWTNFADTDVKPGSMYGYAVRFKGEFDEASFLSPWSVTVVPTTTTAFTFQSTYAGEFYYYGDAVDKDYLKVNFYRSPVTVQGGNPMLIVFEAAGGTFSSLVETSEIPTDTYKYVELALGAGISVASVVFRTRTASQEAGFADHGEDAGIIYPITHVDAMAAVQYIAATCGDLIDGNSGEMAAIGSSNGAQIAGYCVATRDVAGWDFVDDIFGFTGFPYPDAHTNGLKTAIMDRPQCDLPAMCPDTIDHEAYLYFHHGSELSGNPDTCNDWLDGYSGDLEPLTGGSQRYWILAEPPPEDCGYFIYHATVGAGSGSTNLHDGYQGLSLAEALSSYSYIDGYYLTGSVDNSEDYADRNFVRWVALSPTGVVTPGADEGSFIEGVKWYIEKLKMKGAL